MRLLSFVHDQQETYGALTDKGVVDLGATLGEKYPDLRSALEAGALNELEDAAASPQQTIDQDTISYLPVIPNPRKILCIGLNYESHRIETGRKKSAYPTVFTRFADTQTGHRQNIVVPRASRELDYEGELAVIIGLPARHVSRDDAMSYVAGYSCFNDASVRDFQRHGSQFTPGKNFPATGGFGPCLVTPGEVGDAHHLEIRTTLNGDVMQDSNTSRLIFDIPALIHYLSTFTRLMPGDIIATGTPGGVGFKREPQVFLKPGDEIVVEIENVGVLVNPVTAES